MRAMIFAAGLGTRLKPFTLSHPKALVPINGVPMLRRVIEKLKGHGITEIVVNVHHYADQIIDYLNENDNFGIDIVISDETEQLLDTGGGILAARKWLDVDTEPFIVHNADILTDVDIDAMVREHSKTGAEATLLISDRKTSRYLLFDADKRMRGWQNVSTGQIKPQGLDAESLTMMAFGGIHIISPEIFKSLAEYLPERRPFSITDFYIDTCGVNPYYGWSQDTPYHWFDIGKPETLEKAETYLQQH